MFFNRRSSRALGKHDPTTTSPDQNQKERKESSPEFSSGSASFTDRETIPSPTVVFSKRESSPSVSFTISDSQSVNEKGLVNDASVSISDFNSSRKSTDSGDSIRGHSPSDTDQADQAKSFEKSLNNILNKCSIENTVDIEGETKGDDSTLKAAKSERKKKSVPWYSVSAV